jgi:hypothetical protein
MRSCQESAAHDNQFDFINRVSHVREAIQPDFNLPGSIELAFYAPEHRR